MSLTYTCPNCHTVLTIEPQGRRCELCGVTSTEVRPLHVDGKETLLCPNCLCIRLSRNVAGPKETK